MFMVGRNLWIRRLQSKIIINVIIIQIDLPTEESEVITKIFKNPHWTHLDMQIVILQKVYNNQ